MPCCSARSAVALRLFTIAFVPQPEGGTVLSAGGLPWSVSRSWGGYGLEAARMMILPCLTPLREQIELWGEAGPLGGTHAGARWETGFEKRINIIYFVFCAECSLSLSGFPAGAPRRLFCSCGPTHSAHIWPTSCWAPSPPLRARRSRRSVPRRKLPRWSPAPHLARDHLCVRRQCHRPCQRSCPHHSCGRRRRRRRRRWLGRYQYHPSPHPRLPRQSQSPRQEVRLVEFGGRGRQSRLG